MDMMLGLAVVAFVATVLTLVAGLASMTADGEVAHFRSEQWMVARVAVQGITVLLVLIALLSRLA